MISATCPRASVSGTSKPTPGCRCRAEHPGQVHRRWKCCFSPVLYRARNRIERFFNRIELPTLATPMKSTPSNFPAC
jgi:transposase